jgi:signal transduction histidine kinase/ActR/RegA family two-component response regulator
MRSHDWSTSPLGPPAKWPQSLRSVVGLLLQSQFPMFVAWGPDLGFLYNDPYAEILGAKHPRALGSKFYDVWSEIWPDISPLIDAALAGQATYREDLSLLMNRKGFDEQTWFTFSYSPVREEGGAVAGMFCAVCETTPKVLAEMQLRELNTTLEERVAREVAERTKAEEALRQARKLQAIGQLTSGIAHDFNNLLSIISSAAQLLERQKHPERRHDLLEALRHAVERGASLTRQLLGFSRQRPVNPEPVDLAEQIHGMRTILNRSLGGDVQVESFLDADLWPVEVDTGELERAVINLCVNARDAMSGGGIISIFGKNVHNLARGSLTGDFVALSVRDTGVGMSEDVQSRVFEPFFTTKDVGKGSGLGLAQVYGFAKQSGGLVEIETELGRGTTVAILLPRSFKHPVRIVALPGSRPQTNDEDVSRGHVLLVEDDAEVAALAIEMLGAIGFKVTHVSTGMAALGALANGRPFDVVFSDIMMPGAMSGLNLAREIKRRRSDLPIVLTTGYEEAAAGAHAEGIRLILKPYRLEELAETLNVVLGSSDTAQVQQV